MKYQDDQFTEDQIEAINMLEEEGLELVSSPAQIKHGTLMFKDTELKNVYYSITKSGYARRHLKGEVYSPWARKHIPQNAMYQLNKKRPESMYSAGEDRYTELSRITQPGDYSGLADIILRVVNRYRHNNPNESKQENNLRAKTINEVSDYDYAGDLRDKQIYNQFEVLCQKSAEAGLTFEEIEDIFNTAMNNVDWAYAEKIKNVKIKESVNENFLHEFTYKVVAPLNRSKDMIGSPLEDDFGNVFNPEVGDTFNVEFSQGKNDMAIIDYKGERYYVPTEDFNEYVEFNFFEQLENTNESLNEDIFSHPEAWTFKPGDEVRFFMKDVSPEDFGDEDEGELAASHDKMKAVITSQATATATIDELGDKNYEYYDIEFGDGVEMPGVSGYHLEKTYKRD